MVQRQRQRAVGERHGDVHAFGRVHGPVIAKTGYVFGIVEVGEGKRNDEQVLIVDVLDREPHIAVIQQPGDVSLELAALDSRITRGPHAMVVAVKATDVEAPVVAEGPVQVEVIPGQPLGGAGRPHGAGEHVAARLVDEVDDRARSVGPEQRVNA